MNPAIKERPCDAAEDLAALWGRIEASSGAGEAGTTIILTGAAAEQLRTLQSTLSLPAENVLTTALGLLETVARANQDGQQILLASRLGLPLRRVVLPKQ